MTLLQNPPRLSKLSLPLSLSDSISKTVISINLITVRENRTELRSEVREDRSEVRESRREHNGAKARGSKGLPQYGVKVPDNPIAMALQGSSARKSDNLYLSHLIANALPLDCWGCSGYC